MIKTILIANRGEIASRIMRTCRKMGIKTVAVFSEADRNAPFVSAADVAVFIGESNPAASYLDQEKIIAAAKKTGADAIHPGYGFLSENAAFARKCLAEKLIFIGPNPEAIEAMGSKSKAKLLMKNNGVPVVPGYEGDDQQTATLAREVRNIGFPVLLKATAGGGGKGMRIVHKESEISDAVEAAKRESLRAFGDDELIVEKYIASGRHIEFQIFGDKHGNVIHLLERECTIQRRYQKVVEESPSPIMDETLREKMAEAAVNAAKALNYDNAGTVEFIFDDNTGDFYFLEVNTRLQVEHPVTEEITGLDLVQMQIESAQGMPLAVEQSAVKGSGYAVEARLYAEDAANDFLPVTGTVARFEIPDVDGLRVESAIQSGSEISVFYDPMIAKLIVRDDSRAGAHRKMLYVLRNLVCIGLTTNQNFLIHLFNQEDFTKGIYDTHFIQNKINLDDLKSKNKIGAGWAAIAATLFGWQQRENRRTLLRGIPSGWRNSFNDFQQENYIWKEEELHVKYRYKNGVFYFPEDDKNVEVKLIAATEKILRLEIDGVQYSFNIANVKNNFYVHSDDSGSFHLVQKERFPPKAIEKVKGGYDAPMPSQVIKVMVEIGQKVVAGDGLVVLSSMKMENTLYADEDGIVEEIYVKEGANVESGYLLLKIGTA